MPPVPPPPPPPHVARTSTTTMNTSTRTDIGPATRRCITASRTFKPVGGVYAISGSGGGGRGSGVGGGVMSETAGVAGSDDNRRQEEKTLVVQISRTGAGARAQQGQPSPGLLIPPVLRHSLRAPPSRS